MSVAIGAPIVALACAFGVGCKRSESKSTSQATPTSQSTISSWPTLGGGDGGAAIVSPGAPRPGMAFIAPGTLFAGTPRDRVPRIADEEMPGDPVEMGGFYIDILPWPNEPNAIPTTNVSRDEAEQLCGSKGKRLCTELEWERACKGPENHPYEYGPTYRREVCETGVALEQASRRPTGELAQCKSGFGVSELHGGAFEWTSSLWGRSSRDASQGVLRGGNSTAGELVGRCANAIARNGSKKAPTMGFRCCAGAKNAAEVKLSLEGTPGLSMVGAARAAEWMISLAHASGSTSIEIDPKFLHVWTWTPVANEVFVVANGCTTTPRACGFIIARPAAPNASELTTVPVVALSTGTNLAELSRNGDARHLRLRSLDARGIAQRDISYVYGRVDVGEPKRP